MTEGLQKEASSLPRTVWDVAIVGAGPAGATAALHLSSRGHRVLLLDKAAFPRDKVCGDVLTAHALAALHRAGLKTIVEERGHRTEKTLLLGPSRKGVEVPVPFLGLRRRELDFLLAGAARKAGAVWVKGHVTGLTGVEDEEVLLNVKDVEAPIQARVALLATGADVGLARDLGMVEKLSASGVGIRCYVRSSFSFDKAVFSYERSAKAGYGWLFSLGNGWHNAGCGYSHRLPREKRPHLIRVFQTFVREVEPVRAVFDRAETVTELRGARLRYGLKGVDRSHRGRLLLLGETLGATLPASGEGVGQAMRTAEIAAEVVNEALQGDDPTLLGRYPEILKGKLSAQHKHYQWIENLVARAWFAELGGQVARRSAWVRQITAQVMREELDPVKTLLSRGRDEDPPGAS